MSQSDTPYTFTSVDRRLTRIEEELGIDDGGSTLKETIDEVWRDVHR